MKGCFAPKIKNEYLFIACAKWIVNKNFIYSGKKLMEKILISACLLGLPVRYDNKIQPVENECVQKWHKEGRLVVVCPEVKGGLSTPRPPAEIMAGSGEDVLTGDACIHNSAGGDVTRAFITGAQEALDLVQQFHIRMAILKEKSPSCGSHFIYDGSFSRRLIPGRGVTAALLIRNGVAVFSEKDVVLACEFLGML